MRQFVGLTKEEYDKQATESLLYGNQAWKKLGVFRPAYKLFFPAGVQKGWAAVYWVRAEKLRTCLLR